jgi:dTMP kinase
MTDSRGRLIAVEGVDGCGKSTQARILAARLGARLTFEPGATELGQTLRSLVLHGAGDGPAVRAEALLMAADRAQHVAEVIEPQLARGRWVVTDRFSGSTLAYQGYGRGLDVGELARVVAWATSGLEADLSVLVDVPGSVARGRLAAVRPDRLERLDEAFHRRVGDGFRALAEADPRRWAVVDGTPGPAAVARAVAEVVDDRLGRPPEASGGG